MSSFYHAPVNPGNNNNFGGNLGASDIGASGGAASNDNPKGNVLHQFQDQPHQENDFTNNVQQWNAHPRGHSHGQPSQQQQTTQPFWSPNVQQAATQAAAGFMAQAATGNLTSEKVLTQGMDEIQKAFGGGIPGMNYVMRMLRSYFAVDNRYVKRKMLKVLFPFTNKQWRRGVSIYYYIECMIFLLRPWNYVILS
jgi:hypothetical protein